MLLILAAVSLVPSPGLAAQRNQPQKTNAPAIAQRPVATQPQVNVLDVLLSPNLGESTPEDISKRFASKGLPLSKKETNSNPYTGSRTILSLGKAQAGVEQINLQFAFDTTNTTIEGIRAEFTSEEDLKEWIRGYIQRNISSQAKLRHTSPDGASWMLPNGYILWFIQDPSETNTNRKKIRVAYELDQG
ncbi:MAG: hypothetical protein VKP70_09530 [Cyanobacteriota bacterium]|nr:hypothetical protein [Cyanobacteriota bacterium]